MFPRPEDLVLIFDFLSNIILLLGFACIVVAALRFVWVPAGLPATAAISLFLLLSFPFGTALSIYWATFVRPKEAIPRSGSERIWFQYTVALHVMGLLVLSSALVPTFVIGLDGLGDPDPAFDRFLQLIGFALGAVGMVAILAGVWRSANVLWGYRATLVFNVLIAVWIPAGTVLALVWLFVVRKHERQLVSEALAQ